jgi:hypothetical protein
MTKMPKNKRKARMVTGVAWYRAEQWQRLRVGAADVENLEENHEAWLQTAERLLRKGIPSDLTVEKVDVDIEELLAWCNARDLPVDGKARSRYVSEKLRQKYENS